MGGATARERSRVPAVTRSRALGDCNDVPVQRFVPDYRWPYNEIPVSKTNKFRRLRDHLKFLKRASRFRPPYFWARRRFAGGIGFPFHRADGSMDASSTMLHTMPRPGMRKRLQRPSVRSAGDLYFMPGCSCARRASLFAKASNREESFTG